MAAKEFSKEELNFLKFAFVVLNEFPKALREIFAFMWDNRIAPTCQLWDDTQAVRNILQAMEHGCTKIPFNDSFQEWDCTALFQATIYAQTFALPNSRGRKNTLQTIYLKNTKPGSFHLSVTSPSGDQNETLALAIDQLRRLRNTHCHSKDSKLDKVTFDLYVKLVKDAFVVANVDTGSIDYIGNLPEEDFPTNRITVLSQEVQELSKTTSMIQEDIVKIKSKSAQMIEPEIEKEDGNISAGTTNLPPLVPNFTGRSSELKTIVGKLSSESTRLLDIFGSPGFGKTSTAIAAGHDLQTQGHRVYFSTFRRIKLKRDFISKLLSLFRRSTTSNMNVDCTASDKLCCIFNEIPCRVFIILDDIDDLLACSDTTSVKDEVLHFIKETLDRCQNVSFLTTARQSLEFMSLIVEGYQSIRIGPLDQPECESLIRELLPYVASDVFAKITEICGRVPLAIKLLCSSICSNDEVVLNIDSFFESSKGVLDLLDNPDYSSDLRLRVLFKNSFDQLSQQEQEVFSALAIFNGYDFELDAASAVISWDGVVVRQNLNSLVRKSLVDKSAKSGRFSLHPLLHSFAIEKCGDEEASPSSRTKLNNYYISLFHKLNEQFLSGEAMVAFTRFYQDERHIWQSFCASFQDKDLCKKMFDILATAEMFLNALYLKDQDSIELLYDKASRKVLEENNDVFNHRIAVTRCCLNIFKLGRNVNVSNQDKVYSLPNGIGAKCMCYQGMYALSSGLAEQGIRLIENGISKLSNSLDQRFLKLLTSQLLSLYYTFYKNSKAGQFSQIALDMCQEIGDSGLFVISDIESDARGIGQGSLNDDAVISPNKPLVVWICSLLSFWASDYLSVAMKIKLNDIVLEIHRQVLETTQSYDNTLASLLHIGDLALFFLNPSEATQMYDTIVNIATKEGESSVDRAVDEPKKTKTDAQKIKEERLATWYFRRGQYHYFKKEYYLAAESHKRSLWLRLELNGVYHAKTADSYQLLGNAHSKMNDISSALDDFKCALDIRQQVLGEQDRKTADTYEVIGIQQDEIGDHASAFESHSRALAIRLNIYGKKHPIIAKSYLFIGVTEEAMENYPSALQFYRDALEVNVNWYGKTHVKTAEIYQLIGNIQVNTEDYSSALESYNCALHIRQNMHGESDTLKLLCCLYKIIGVLYQNLGDFKSALKSHLDALEITLQLHGREHSETAECHQNIGIMHYSMGNLLDALQSHQHALRIRVHLHGEEHSMTADCCHNIGIVEDLMKNHTLALGSHQRGLNIRLKVHGKDDAKTACSYHLRGITQNNMGDYSAALQSHKCERDIRLRLYGDAHVETVDSYQSIGITQDHLGNHVAALKSLQHALNVIVQLFGTQHVKAADIYQCISRTHNGAGDYDLALRALQCVLDIRLKLYGENVMIADCHYNIGIVQRNKGDFQAAVQSHDCELEIRLKFYGEKNRKTADSYHHAGSAQNHVGNYELAVELLQHALRIRRELYNDENDAVIANSYRYIGIVLHNKRNFESALYHFQQALDIRSNIFGNEHMKTTESYFDVLETKAVIKKHKRKSGCVIN